MRQKAALFAVCLGSLAASCATTRKSNWGGDGKVVQTAMGLCLEMTPESQLNRVAVCESPDQKSFAVIAPGQSPVIFPKEKAQALLQERLRHFLAKTPYPAQGLAGAKVELWVVAPVFAPEEVYLTAFVEARGGNFAVRLPLAPERWAPEARDVVLLGKDSYPSAAARRAGLVMVTPKPYVRAADFTRFLAANGLEGQGDGVVSLPTPAFGEEGAARVLLKAKEARYYVQTVELAPAGERDGAKARALTFALGT